MKSEATDRDRELARDAVMALPSPPCDTFANMATWRAQHWVDPYARVLSAVRIEERERCAKIAHDLGLRSHKDFRWMAEEIEAEIRK